MSEQQNPLAGLTMGRVVWYKIPSGVYRCALVTMVWNAEQGVINLRLQHNGMFDGYPDGEPSLITSVKFDQNPEAAIGTWKWPERA